MKSIKKRIRILTNHPGQAESPTWNAVTTYVPYRFRGILGDTVVALELLRHYPEHDCVVLGAGRSDTIFGLILRLLPLPQSPCIKIDCLWYRSKTRFRSYCKRLLKKFIDKTIDCYVVWASHEIIGYSTEFSLPKDKFIFIPYHTTLDNSTYEIRDDNYLFSGGNFTRDYRTLIQAVDGLPVKLLIASTRPEIFTDLNIPENVEIQGFSHEEYIQKMAACTINIVSLTSGLLHSGGQQTFLNSMYMGKPTIVNDPEGAKDYITNGVDGVITPSADPAALRAAIMDLYDHPEKAKKMGKNARRKAADYISEIHFSRIVDLVNQLISKYHR